MQSHLMSLVESALNTASGFLFGLAGQWVFLPLIGVQIDMQQNLQFAAIMAVVSVCRGFGMRRLFVRLGLQFKFTPGMIAILAERRRQVDVEGWTAEHDDEAHDPGDLAAASAAYAIAAAEQLARDARPADYDEPAPDMPPPACWPWRRAWWTPEPKARRNLTKAGALLLAQLDSLDRNRKERAA